MLEKNKNGTRWKKDVLKKLMSFADKCPLLLSITTGVYKNAEGVYVSVAGDTDKFFFQWKYDQEPKEFVYTVKSKLLPKYPRIIQTEQEERPATAMEIAEQLEQGLKLEETKRIIKSVTGSTLWRIDKYLHWSQIFILTLEQAYDANGNTVEFSPLQKKYLYNGLGLMFLRNYRNGTYESPQLAGDAFFNNSSLITTIKMDKK